MPGLPRHLGDHPDGAYWTVDVPEGHVEPDLLEIGVNGHRIRLMWDYGVRVPLWDDHGHLPEEPEWLREVLGLSDGLAGALREWGEAMNDLDGHRGATEAAHAELDRQGRELAERLREELRGRFEVTYHPW